MCVYLLSVDSQKSLSSIDMSAQSNLSGFKFKRFVESQRLLVFLLLHTAECPAVYIQIALHSSLRMKSIFDVFLYTRSFFSSLSDIKTESNFLLSFDNIIYLFCSHSHTQSKSRYF